MKKHLPNLVTCLNATCGAAAIFLVLHERVLLAAALVLLAMLFDFLDGLLARLLRVTSAMGKELDSLADVVSFGVVPALLAHVLIRDALPADARWTSVLPYLPVIIPAFSAYRLAVFNLDTRQDHSFRGMPTPAHALFWVSLLFARHHAPCLYDATWGNPWLLAACVLFFSVLLISGLPMFSLKIVSFAWASNRWLYSYLILALLALLVFRAIAVSFLVPLYVLLAAAAALVKGRGCNRQSRGGERR
ncbi:MAG: CDP-diacylglycerol--serine O-phosphatidyltransferase [Odoribacteraceae bacterium]|jgi:CDP-diacylglycerol--serine O-phosphatidyltransferase|nr:CDP-diacylglycerol--serine O-phosphatidyltransferase [Odoribacteraceae bacterium]